MRKNRIGKPATVSFVDQNFTVDEAAAHLTVSRGYFFRLLNEGRIARTKIGSRTLIRGRELQRFLDEADGLVAKRA